MTVTITNTDLTLRTEPEVRRYSDIRELLPGPDNPTPLVRLNNTVARPNLESYLKLEWMNPFGSLKDRAAAYLLSGMAERGDLEGRDIVRLLRAIRRLPWRSPRRTRVDQASSRSCRGTPPGAAG